MSGVCGKRYRLQVKTTEGGGGRGGRPGLVEAKHPQCAIVSRRLCARSASWGGGTQATLIYLLTTLSLTVLDDDDLT
ncbi:MAG: hypothetical protein LBJ08_06810 [Bifidobacteriaceae bacterium]|nr:hypothetical protein [Bifidobacteriaceae bacterium]